MLLATLAFIAVFLTFTMFHTRQPMLGFACVIFWALVGAQAYTLSTVAWGDIYYYIAFSSLLGMTTFSALSAFGLREKRDSLGDMSMEGTEKTEKSGKYFDEKKESENLFEVPQPPEGKRSKELHERAEKRRSGEYAGSARGSRKLW